MTNQDDRMLELRSAGFLTRLQQLSERDTGVRLNAGDVGQELGYPLEHTLEIVARLHRRGEIHRCGPLALPHGPEVHLTAQGARADQRAA